jgi:hypothetical protein
VRRAGYSPRAVWDIAIRTPTGVHGRLDRAVLSLPADSLCIPVTSPRFSVDLIAETAVRYTVSRTPAAVPHPEPPPPAAPSSSEFLYRIVTPTFVPGYRK